MQEHLIYLTLLEISAFYTLTGKTASINWKEIWHSNIRLLEINSCSHPPGCTKQKSTFSQDPKVVGTRIKFWQRMTHTTEFQSLLLKAPKQLFLV